MKQKYIFTESQIELIKKYLINEQAENSGIILSSDYCDENISGGNPEALKFWKQETLKNPEQQKASKLSPAQYEPLLRNKKECSKFQSWVKTNHPEHDLGPFGPNKDGVDGLYGKRTKKAWQYYGKEYLGQTGSDTNQQTQNTNLSPTKQKIETDIKNSIMKAKNEYINWFSNKGTIDKFKNKNLVRNLITYIKSLGNYIAYYDETKSPNKKPNAWVWGVKTKQQLNDINFKKIHLNIFNMHDGKNYISPIYQTIYHEMGHIIDGYLTKNGESAYLPTHETFNQEQYQQNYIINDKDQYSRLQVFRNIVGAAPLDNGEQLLNRFLNKYQSGEIKISGYTPSKIYLDKVPEKRDTKNANLAYNFLYKKIIVNGTPSHNTAQLFATFTYFKDVIGQSPNYYATLYTSFDKIGELNITSKGVDQNLQTEDNKRYVYLKLTPVQQQPT